MTVVDYAFCPLRFAGGHAEVAQVLKDSRNRLRRHPENLRLMWQSLQNLRHFIPGRRAHLTEVLSENQIGREFRQKFLVDLIEAQPLSHSLSDSPINLALAHC